MITMLDPFCRFFIAVNLFWNVSSIRIETLPSVQEAIPQIEKLLHNKEQDIYFAIKTLVGRSKSMKTGQRAFPQHPSIKFWRELTFHQFEYFYSAAMCREMSIAITKVLRDNGYDAYIRYNPKHAVSAIKARDKDGKETEIIIESGVRRGGISAMLNLINVKKADDLPTEQVYQIFETINMPRILVFDIKDLLKTMNGLVLPNENDYWNSRYVFNQIAFLKGDEDELDYPLEDFLTYWIKTKFEAMGLTVEQDQAVKEYRELAEEPLVRFMAKTNYSFQQSPVIKDLIMMNVNRR